MAGSRRSTRRATVSDAIKLFSDDERYCFHAKTNAVARELRVKANIQQLHFESCEQIDRAFVRHAGAVVTAKHDRRAEARAPLEARGKLALDWDDDFPIGDDASVGDKHQAPEKVRDVAHLAWVVLQIVVGIQKAHAPL